MGNINDNYFAGQYKDIWRAMIPQELTEKEAAFMLSWFKLTKGSWVLDIMCGYGRHALALARHGINVVAVDNLMDYTNELMTIAKTESLPIVVETSNVLSYQPHEEFDLAICMGNSLNFFDKQDTIQILTT